MEIDCRCEIYDEASSKSTEAMFCGIQFSALLFRKRDREREREREKTK